MSKKNMPAVLDREIARREADAFGHRHFADALRSLVEDQTLPPPYSIGLLGGWGTGKSTIKSIYLNGLKDDATKPLRKERIHTVTFNAWRYSDDVKPALLRQVFLAIGGNPKKLEEKLFNEIRRTESLPKKFFAAFFEQLKVIAPSLLLVGVILVLAGALIAGLILLLGVQDDIAKSFIVMSMIGLIVALFSKIGIPLDFGAKPVTIVEPPSSSSEHYQQLIIDQLHTFKDGKANIENASKCERLVVFVDDLDRLSAEEMVQGLDAVRTFMEIQSDVLPQGLGIVFVISCDEERIAHALEKNRRHSELPGTVFTRSDARRYLDRIFQFRLEIPPFPRRDMREFSISKLKELDLRGLTIPIEEVVERMIHVDVWTPRNALQIINAFAQTWWLAYRRENNEAGTNRAGALYEGAVTNHPLSLAVLSAIRVDFPDFFADLQRRHDLVDRFADVMLARASLEDQPDEVQALLTQYFEKRTLDDGNTTHGPDVKLEYRRLRRFLASLQNHRWPPSIQPLILLSQDAVSRKYGDGRQTIYDSLVSGDTRGVLEGFGRSVDSKPLQASDVHLLKDMMEEVASESDSRRTRASIVLASLIDRLPNQAINTLSGPLTRQLEESMELRWRIGIPLIQNLLTSGSQRENQALGAVLVDDLLAPGTKFPYLLPSGEPANLDEARNIVAEGLSLILQIRRKHGLGTAPDVTLKNWLSNRVVKLSEEDKYEFPTPQLVEWAIEHSDHLKTLMCEELTDQLITDLETQSEPEYDLTAALEIANDVFETLQDSGEKSRPILWGQISRLASVNNGAAVSLALKILHKHPASSNSDLFSDVVEALSNRFTESLSNSERDDLDDDSSAKLLLGAIESRPSDISNDAQAALSDLVVEWSNTEELATYAVRGLPLLSGSHAESVIDNWIECLVDGLPEVCIDHLARTFVKLPEEKQEALCSKLDSQVAPGFTKESGASYDKFLRSLPKTAWSLTPLKNHLNTVIPLIGQHHNNPEGFLTNSFPAISKVLRYGEHATVGAALQMLFSNAVNQQGHYGLLHGYMINNWPPYDESYAPYNPVKIFEQAGQFANSNSSAKNIIHILRSMKNMIDQGLIEEESRSELAMATCAVWSGNPVDAAEFMLSSKLPFSTSQVSEFANAIDWNEGEALAALKSVWAHVSVDATPEELIEVALELAESTSNADKALKAWIESSQSYRDVIIGVLKSEKVTDPGRVRLWAQARFFSDKLDPEFFMDAVPFLLTCDDNEETANSIFGTRNDISDHFQTAETKSKLARALLLDGFINAPTNTIKGGAAKWAKDLDAGKSLLNEIDSQRLTTEDVDILTEHFGESAVKGIRQKVSAKER